MGVFIFTRPSAARSALLLAAGLTLVTPALAQNAVFDAATTNAATSPLQQALSAEKTPLTLPASALDASWRRFKPNKALNSNFNIMPYEQTISGTSDNYSYFTQGVTFKVGDETFLLAYRTPFFLYQPLEQYVSEDSVDIAPSGTIEEKDLPADFKENIATSDRYLRVLPTQTLNLCLLNVRTIDGMGDIRAFDAQTDLIKVVTIADKERVSEQSVAERAQLTGDAVNQRVTSDLRQIGLALAASAGDYDQEMPPMRSAQSMAEIKQAKGVNWPDPLLGTFQKAQQVLLPYVKIAEIFAHPTTREIYRPNVNVSRRPFFLLEPTDQVVTFYEASPASDGRRAVLYLDGHVTRELETDWLAIRAASDAIAPPFKSGAPIMVGKPTHATITLYDAAAIAYMLRYGRDNEGRAKTVYLSKSTNRIYYRDPQTHQAIWLSSPDGKTVKGITIPYASALEFSEFQGYNRQTKGRTFGDDRMNAAVFTPKIKTALGANAALSGSQINVDTLGDSKTVALRGIVLHQAQKSLAEAIARKNAPGFRIVNQLVVKIPN